jgi:hypothetical protein
MITEAMLYPGTPSGALFGIHGDLTDQDDGAPYRYTIHRTWREGGPPEVWILCNPSTATATKPDNTNTRVKEYSYAWGAGGYALVNMSALRSTFPIELQNTHKRGEDAIGPHNDAALIAALMLGKRHRGRVMLAWGGVLENLPTWRARVAWLGNRAAEVDVELMCLAVTKAGHPHHPLRLHSSLEPRPWSPMAIG